MSQPSLFISHGAPDIAVRDIPATQFLSQLGQKVKTPKAILMASAHWCTHMPVISNASNQHAIHDFVGFGHEIYNIEYDTNGHPRIAERVAQLLTDKGIKNELINKSGMDHGVWTPLVHMFPERNVPVIPISTQPLQSAMHYFELGRALAPLREENVLIIGSGSITHNLSAMTINGSALPLVARADEFAHWVADAVHANDLDTLFDYRNKSPNYSFNHPTDEHFLPLFFSLGAGYNNNAGKRIHHSWAYGALALDAYKFGCG